MTSTAAYLLIKTAYARHGGIGASNEGTQHRRMRSGNPNTQEYDTPPTLQRLAPRWQRRLPKTSRKAPSAPSKVGEAYAVYERALDKADAVDFGDLVLLAARLIENTPAVQQYVAGFKHVLVDEYQDVNFASARLLRAICAL